MNDLKNFSFSNLGSPNSKLCVQNLDEFVGKCNFDYSKTQTVNCLTIVICTGGEVKYMLDFNTVDLKEGDVLFLSPGQVFYCHQPKRISGVLVSFTDDFFDTPSQNDFFNTRLDLFNDLSQKVCLSIPVKRRANVYCLIDMLKMEIELSNLKSTSSILQHLLSALLEALNRESVHVAKEEVLVAERSLAKKYRIMVQKNISVKNNVEYFCHELKISKSTLQKATRLTYNMTPKDIIEEALMLEAKRLMISSSMRIQEIAFSLGFTDPTNFTKFFKRNVGMTPEGFRKSQQNKLLSYEI